MKRAILTSLMALLAGLLAAGTALAEQQQRDEAQLQISARQLNSDQILELQRSLQKQGVDPGPVDGKMGPLTRQAIQIFQQQEGLAATGDIDERTLDALDIEVQEFLGMSPAFSEERVQQRQRQQQAQLRVSVDQLNRAQVLELQRSLQQQGVDPGPVDGQMGPLTRQAIQIFQQQEGLAATGEINEPTLEALEIEVQEFMGMSPAFE